MEKKVDYKEHNIHVICGDLLAIVQKKPNRKGLHGITFSQPVPIKVADWLNQSGIVNVQSWKKNGILTFYKEGMFCMDKFTEVVMDVLDKQWNEK